MVPISGAAKRAEGREAGVRTDLRQTQKPACTVVASGRSAGPEEFRFDEFIAQALAARGDARTVVADPHAKYFGAELADGSLVPEDVAAARLGEITFAEWQARQASAPAR